MAKGQTAWRDRRGQVGIEWQPGAQGPTAKGASGGGIYTLYEWRRRDVRATQDLVDSNVRNAAKKIPPSCGSAGEGKLRPDISRERPRGGHNARLDLHLLPLAIELANQVIHHRHHRRDVADDECIGAVIREDLT